MGNLEKYQAFRKRYPEFIYESYDIERQPGEVKLAFRFSVPGLGEFAPQWTLPMPDNPAFPPESPLFQNLAFQLGLVELISYWKIACPPPSIFRGLGSFSTKTALTLPRKILCRSSLRARRCRLGSRCPSKAV